MKVLVIKHGALGDMVIGFLAFQAIRAHHPNARIILLTSRPFAVLGRQMPWFDEVWIDDRPRWWQPLRWWRLVRRVVGAGFTRVYDLQGSDRTALLFGLLPRRCRPEWTGPVAGASHPRPLRASSQEHVRDWIIRHLRSVGLERFEAPELGWLDGDVERFGVSRPWVLLVPGCAPHRPEKRWPPENYGALARLLVERGQTPVVLGIAQEQVLAARIRAVCPQAVDLTGRTELGDIAALARQAVGAIGNDTGPMHLIAQTGCPTLVLFSAASNPNQISPVGQAVTSLQVPELAGLGVAEVEAAWSAAMAAKPSR